MKRIALLFAFAVSAFVSNGQLTLTGTSYTQNFDGISSGLPTGWVVYSASSSTSLGTIGSFTGSTYPPSVMRPDTSCIGLVNVGGFKNFPSATVSHPGDDYCAATPPSYTNRALGVRQVSPTNATHPNLDSGAAFVLELNNTTGFYNFFLSFKLQSLDTSSTRTTTWMVDYAIGSPTSFTPATTTTGTWTTGGNAFSNNTVTVNFHHALDNQAGNVYIRIVTLLYSAGSGNRASTGIDDYSLHWLTVPTTSVSNVSATSGLSINVLGAATTDKINLGCTSEETGIYSLNVYDLAGRIMHTENVNMQDGFQQITVDGLHLAPGMYFAKMNNANSSTVTRVVVQ